VATAASDRVPDEVSERARLDTPQAMNQPTAGGRAPVGSAIPEAVWGILLPSTSHRQAAA